MLIGENGMCFAMEFEKMALGVLCNLVLCVEESSAEYELSQWLVSKPEATPPASLPYFIL